MSYRRHIEDNRKLRKLYCATKHSYIAGVFYDTQKQRYIRFSPNRGSGYTKYLRRKSNKQVRKSQDKMNYSTYRRRYDYLWELI